MTPPHRPVNPRVSFPALEEEVLQRWRDRDVFHRSVQRRAGGSRWGFYEGPPTANGPPATHHVLSRVFKDIFPRYRTMTGHQVHRKGGWDCHGLPVELALEAELGFNSKDDIERFGIAEFNARCREKVLSHVAEWNRLTERIGFWVDLDDAYRTLDPSYVESVWWALKTIHEHGLLYEKLKVVPYCPRDQVTLSSHELGQPGAYRDVVDPSVYVRLPVTEPQGPAALGDELLVWTTTPWTLVSNAAVAVHPDLTYVRARGFEDQVEIVAESLVERVLGAAAEVIERFPGSALVGTRYEPPFSFISGDEYGPKGHTVLAAEFVTAQEGTGLVHTAIAFGEDDFRLGEREGLQAVNPVRLDGTYDERIGPYAGRWVKDADADLIEDLRSRGRLLRAERYTHSYPHCWRCDTPLLYYAKPSWYIATSQIRDRLLAANETVNWYPDHVKHGRFGNWLEGNVDWALSRERYWGTPLPVWRCSCGRLHVIGSLGELEQLSGVALDDPHRPYVDDVTFPCASCGEPMKRVPEVIDVWFDSGSMPFAEWGAPHVNQDRFEERFPADFICEALDQTRGWFYSMLAVSTLLFDRSSFRNVVCLGLILDEEGRKMSKSLGNTIEPWDVLDRYGADALRWYFFTSKLPWDGYRFSLDAIGESLRQFLLQLWNTYGFYVLYANANGIGPDAAAATDSADRAAGLADPAAGLADPAAGLADPAAGLADPAADSADPAAGLADPAADSADPAADLDRWVLSRLQATIATVRERLDDFDATMSGRALQAFVDELSNWYVRRSRRRFWDGDAAAFATLRTCLVAVSQMLAPFCPFVADEIYDNLDGSEVSVHLSDFPVAGERDLELEAAMDVARDTVRLGLAARAQAKIKIRQPLRAAVVVATGRERAAIRRLAGLVSEELNVHELRFVSAADELSEIEVKPNYRTLGPRFGKQMPLIAAAVAGLDAAHVAAALRDGRSVSISVAGTEHHLGADDLLVALRPLAGYQLEAEGSHAVALEVELDDALRAEGWAREIVRAVQNARQAAGLEVSDRIALRLGGDADLLAAAREHEPYIAGETLAVDVGYELAEGEGEAVEFDGRPLRIALVRRGIA